MLHEITQGRLCFLFFKFKLLKWIRASGHTGWLLRVSPAELWGRGLTIRPHREAGVAEVGRLSHLPSLISNNLPEPSGFNLQILTLSFFKIFTFCYYTRRTELHTKLKQIRQNLNNCV